VRTLVSVLHKKFVPKKPRIELQNEKRNKPAAEWERQAPDIANHIFNVIGKVPTEIFNGVLESGERTI